jgi:hypothetical protein
LGMQSTVRYYMYVLVQKRKWVLVTFNQVFEKKNYYVKMRIYTYINIHVHI